MDIYQRLEQDHAAVRRLFERLEGTPASAGAAAERGALFASLREALLAHLLAEQKIFYDSLLARADDQDRLLESVEVHAVVARLLDEIDAGGTDDGCFATKVAELEDVVEQHVAEEESVVFATARRHLSAEQATQLGDEFEAFKERDRMSAVPDARSPTA